MESSADIAKKIGETLNWKLVRVEDVLEIDEDKQGIFVVTLKPKKFLDAADFKTICALTRDLGGDGNYVKASRSWKVPGALAKKTPEKAPSKELTSDRPTTYKESGNAAPANPYTLLPVDALLTMPFVRRKDMEGPDFEDLVQSVKALGVLEPIIVRPKPNGLFEVVVGDRRHAASKKAKLLEIPAIVKPLSDEEAYGIRIVENVQRKDLSDMEKAEWLSFMIKTFGYTQEVLAKKLGKTQQWVSQHLSMLQIPESITRVIKHGEITEYQAREILSAPEDKREAIVNEINKTGELPSAREIHELAHPEQKPKTVPCEHCGEPIQGEPIHADGKFYDQECYEQVQAEKTPGLIPETDTGPFEKEPSEDAEDSQEEKSSKSDALKAIQIGEFDCTKCGQHFLIDHLPNGQHKLRLVRTAD